MPTRPLLDVLASFNFQTGTTYTLNSSDNNKVVVLTNAAPVILTLPNSLPQGFNCIILQGGAGQVTVQPAAGATRNNRSGHTKLAGPHASGAVLVTDNASGNAAVYNFSGDTEA